MRDLQEQNEGGPNPMWLEVRALIDSQLLASEIMSEVVSAARRVQNAPDCIPMHDVFLSKQLQSLQGNSAGVGIFLSGIPFPPPSTGNDVVPYWGFGRKGGRGGGGADVMCTERQDPAFKSFTCGQIFNPVGVRTHSLERSVVYVWLVTRFDGWLVDTIEDVQHIQVCVVVAEQVPASIQATCQICATVDCFSKEGDYAAWPNLVFFFVPGHSGNASFCLS